MLLQLVVNILMPIRQVVHLTICQFTSWESAKVFLSYLIDFSKWQEIEYERWPCLEKLKSINKKQRGAPFTSKIRRGQKFWQKLVKWRKGNRHTAWRVQAKLFYDYTRIYVHGLVTMRIDEPFLCSSQKTQ